MPGWGKRIGLCAGCRNGNSRCSKQYKPSHSTYRQPKASQRVQDRIRKNCPKDLGPCTTARKSVFRRHGAPSLGAWRMLAVKKSARLPGRLRCGHKYRLCLRGDASRRSGTNGSSVTTATPNSRSQVGPCQQEAIAGSCGIRQPPANICGAAASGRPGNRAQANCFSRATGQIR